MQHRLDNVVVGLNMYTLLVGAFIGVLALTSIFSRNEGKTSVERGLQRTLKIAFVIGMGAWLVIWFTEPAIWASAGRICASYASIELKGQVYRTCSYLVHRHQAAEWIFGASWLAGAICILVPLINRQRQRHHSEQGQSKPDSQI